MIHVVGNVAIDTLLRVDSFPRPGETIVARSALEDLCGKGANQAVVLARCGQTSAPPPRLAATPPASGSQTSGRRRAFAWTGFMSEAARPIATSSRSTATARTLS